ncbi:MAG: hypothetical protein IJC86_05265 [Clostridia bacterium]|nr:hypothetical protein [Clostridia bacterium]
MDKSERGLGVPADSQFMMLAENARTVNQYASLGPAGQQVFLYKLSTGGSQQEQQKLIEELTR